jgi:Fe-S-cluster-containing hydrogenase component 2
MVMGLNDGLLDSMNDEFFIVISDNILCNGCLTKVDVCPFCRVSYEKKPARRNRWAERLIWMEKRGRHETGDLVK